MDIEIRKERAADQKTVFNLIEKAFKNEEISDHSEHFLVDRLRNSDAFIPELSLVAENLNIIVGHILLTKIKIRKGSKESASLALAPVSVLPEFQGKGIGGKLILEAHRIARELGYKSVILLGHAHYYPRFGYKPAADFGIKLPFDVPGENCMAIELVENALADSEGMVVYPEAFML